MVHRKVTALVLGLAAASGVAGAQSQPAPSGGQPDEGPKPGDVAPDFSLPGSTKAGLLSKPVRLADYRGQVVVLAFYPKARTSG
jgi:peroxiredoxin Q/BCP